MQPRGLCEARAASPSRSTRHVPTAPIPEQTQQSMQTIDLLSAPPQKTGVRKLGRLAMGAAMVFAGIGHLTFARRAFRAQVPKFAPRLTSLSVDEIVVWSGVVEITMGAGLLLLPRQRKLLGWTLAFLYVAIFPGNIAQWKHNRSAFGLDTDAKRFLRLFFQPLLIAGALWSTDAVDDVPRLALGAGKRSLNAPYFNG